MGDAEGDCDIVKTTTAQIWNEALNEVGTPPKNDSRRIGKILCELMEWKRIRNVTIAGYTTNSRGFSR